MEQLEFNIAVNGALITVAREFRGMTATELKDALGISATLLSFMERNKRPTNPDLLEGLSSALGFPKSFFLRSDQIYMSNSHWRRKTTSPARFVKQAEAEMSIHRLVMESMLSSLVLTDKVLPSMDAEEYGSPTIVAKAIRQLWRIPKGPIHDLFSVIESNGAFIVQCDFVSGIEGRTMFTKHKEPIIFVNKNSGMDRQRLTVAHELGHLILHENNTPKPPDLAESEAMEFASEFLMPADQLRPQLSRTIQLETLADLKRYWKVSMQAILVRAKREGLISPTNYIRIWKRIGALGLKKREPSELDPPPEKPTMLQRMIETHISELDYTLDELAELGGLKPSQFQSWYLFNERVPVSPQLRIHK